MRYYMQSRLIVKCPSGNEYLFVTQHNICGALVDPADVDFIAAKRGGCCGQRRAGVFRVGTDTERKKWEA